jgi:uncharacterized membrane protein
MKKEFKRLITFFLQGVLVVAPVAVTAYLIYWLFTSIDSLIPIFTTKNEIGQTVSQNRGLGFVIIIFSLLIIGYLSSNFITGRLFTFFDHLLERMPGVKQIYSTVKDFFEAFAGNKRKFTKPVRVFIRKNPEIWQIGFITQEDLSKITDTGLISVYMPHSYAVSGVTVLVHPDSVVAITGIEASAAMKMAISGGVAGYDDEDGEPENDNTPNKTDKIKLA